MNYNPQKDSEYLQEGLATAATLQPVNFRANMRNYPLVAMEVHKYCGFRIVIGAGRGFNRLIEVKNLN